MHGTERGALRGVAESGGGACAREVCEDAAVEGRVEPHAAAGDAFWAEEREGGRGGLDVLRHTTTTTAATATPPHTTAHRTHRPPPSTHLPRRNPSDVTTLARRNRCSFSREVSSLPSAAAAAASCASWASWVGVVVGAPVQFS